MPSIRVKNLKKYFGKVKAVDGINFEAEDGEFIALLGPSGCGKTTTLLMLAGIYKPTEGEIFFDDKLVNNVPPKYRKIGMVFQNYALYPHMNVFENIAFPLKTLKLSREKIREKVLEIANRMFISEILERKPTQISGGQQQRVALARALVKEPEILLFDEPLSNLDANLRMLMRAEIKRLQSELGITSVYVTHDQAEAMTMASRIAVFNFGKIVQYGTPDEIYDKPSNMFVASFIGNPPMNFLKGFSVKSVNSELHIFRDDVELILPLKMKKGIFESGVEKFILGFRPEDCEIEFESSTNSIPGTVYVLEPLGRDIIINVKIESTGEMVKVFADKSKIPERDQTIHLVPKIKKIHLFDPESELTII